MFTKTNPKNGHNSLLINSPNFDRELLVLLNEVGSEVGALFKRDQSDIEKVLRMRNESLMAHGYTPVGEANYEQVESVVRRLWTPREQIVFPQLDWDQL